MKILIKSEHKEILKKILYKGRKYGIKYYKKHKEITLYKPFVYSLLLVIPFYPFFTDFSDKYDNKTTIGKISFIGNNDLYIENPLINSLLININSKEQLIEPKIYSTCENNQQLLSKKEEIGKYEYLINFQLVKTCDNPNIFIENGDRIYTKTLTKINIINFGSLFNEFTDYNNSKIKELLTSDNNVEIGNNTYSSIKNNIISDYKKSILKLISKKRQNLRYIVPVAGKEIPTRPNIIPNAPRPYRANYTDGIHHGWDIFATRGTPVRALGDGIIYRIKNDFVWESFDGILWKNLTSNDRLINLDIYRGNQVWIKTYDGNITIYAHLENIPTNLKEGQFVKAGEYLGQVGKSGVPDKEYTDFHLHFEIQVNPHIYKANSLLDIMQRPYFGKGKKYDEIIEGQTKLFAK